MKWIPEVYFVLTALLAAVCLSGCGDSIAGEKASLGSNFEVKHFAEDDGLARRQVQATAVCPNGDAWFGYGVSGGGVTKFDGSSWGSFTTEDGLERSGVYALACDRAGVLWIGYGINAGGLTRYDGDTFVTYAEDDGLSSNRIEAIGVGPGGEIWIGFGNQSNGVDRLGK